jgi:hypothetical protein
MLTTSEDGLLRHNRVLICDRDQTWSRSVRQRFGAAGIRVVLTPKRAPNANAYAERFVLDQGRISRVESFRWGAARPTRDHGVCGARSPRTESPRTRQWLIAGTPPADVSGRGASSFAGARTAQLRRACRVTSESAEVRNITGFHGKWNYTIHPTCTWSEAIG